jgi:Uma2 family endonuclease
MVAAQQAAPVPEAAPVSTALVVEHEAHGEQRFVLHDVPWQTYVLMRDALDDGHAGLKMTYLEGTLELMSPSNLHELAKKLIARLLEIWAMERNVRLVGLGGTTWRKEAKKRGLEADECYKLGPYHDGDLPDLALEVIVSSPLVDKMAVYAGLGVSELWLWRAKQQEIVVYRLVGESYELRERSELLPQLDLAQLASFVRRPEQQYDIVDAYLAALRAR